MEDFQEKKRQLLVRIKTSIKQDMKNGINKYIQINKKYLGKECKKCGIIQGAPALGFERYYCKHIDALINSKLKKEKKEITQKMISFAILSSVQIET